MRVNVCEHIKRWCQVIVLCKSHQEEGRGRGNGGKRERELSEVNSSAGVWRKK
jgi:hypothetical protein